jgi:hypothetical protein
MKLDIEAPLCSGLSAAYFVLDESFSDGERVLVRESTLAARKPPVCPDARNRSQEVRLP